MEWLWEMRECLGGDPVSTECREESRVKGGRYATGSLCDLDLTFNRGSFLNEKLG